MPSPTFDQGHEVIKRNDQPPFPFQTSGPQMDLTGETVNSQAYRVGRWKHGGYYQLGKQNFRFFSVVSDPFKSSDNTYSYMEGIANSAIKDVSMTEDTCFIERIDFPAKVAAQLVVTGFLSLQSGYSGWAGIYTVGDGSASNAWCSLNRNNFYYRYGWETFEWRVGDENAKVPLRLQYADMDGSGIAWAWLI